MERSVDVTAPVSLPFELAGALLCADPAGALGGRPSGDGGPFATEIGLEVVTDVTVTQRVEVELAELEQAPGLVRFGLCWKASSHAGAFPVFGGDLELQPEGHSARLRIHGHYRLPMGQVGAAGDALIGHRVAHRVFERLAQTVARRLEDAAARQDQSPEPIAAAELFWG